MSWRDVLGSSLASLYRSLTRSALTMLGIVIGVSSVILILSIGEAAQRFILGQVSALGADLIMVQNGQDITESRDIPTAFLKETLTLADYRALRLQPWVKVITATISQSDEVVTNGQNNRVQVIGTTEDEASLYNLSLASGTFFTSEDVAARTKVVVIGADIAEQSFGQESALGRLLKIGTQTLRVVGVLSVAGTRNFQNLDQNVYIPVTVAMDVYHKKFLDTLSLKTSLSTTRAKRLVQDTLHDQHRINLGEVDDFRVSTQAEVVRSADQITTILQVLLTSIAAISLLVGGIGIMNIMYVAVTERTREIGLRRALGARARDVLRQFMAEATCLTAIGGVIGCVVGIGLTWLTLIVINTFQSGWIFAVSWRGVLLGVGVSTMIGLIFGYAPAKQAAKLHPIDALRKE